MPVCCAVFLLLLTQSLTAIASPWLSDSWEYFGDLRVASHDAIKDGENDIAQYKEIDRAIDILNEQKYTYYLSPSLTEEAKIHRAQEIDRKIQHLRFLQNTYSRRNYDVFGMTHYIEYGINQANSLYTKYLNSRSKGIDFNVGDEFEVMHKIRIFQDEKRIVSGKYGLNMKDNKIYTMIGLMHGYSNTSSERTIFSAFEVDMKLSSGKFDGLNAAYTVGVEAKSLIFTIQNTYYFNTNASNIYKKIHSQQVAVAKKFKINSNSSMQEVMVQVGYFRVSSAISKKALSYGMKFGVGVCL